MIKYRTKLMFANEIKELIKTTPVDKITITELCKRCETIPQTFYYHFHDKYELISWIFLYDFSYVLINSESEYSPNIIEKCLRQIEKNKDFYKRAYLDCSQNSINSFINEFITDLSTKIVKQRFGNLLSNKQQIEIKFYTYGTMALFKDWLYQTIPMSIQQFSAFQYQNTPTFLKEALNKYKFNPRDFYCKKN